MSLRSSNLGTLWPLPEMDEAGSIDKNQTRNSLPDHVEDLALSFILWAVGVIEGY